MVRDKVSVDKYPQTKPKIKPQNEKQMGEDYQNVSVVQKIMQKTTEPTPTENKPSDTYIDLQKVMPKLKD